MDSTCMAAPQTLEMSLHFPCFYFFFLFLSCLCVDDFFSVRSLMQITAAEACNDGNGGGIRTIARA